MEALSMKRVLPKCGNGLTPQQLQAYDKAYDWMSSYYRSPGYINRFFKIGDISKDYFNSKYNYWYENDPGQEVYKVLLRPKTFTVGNPINYPLALTLYGHRFNMPLDLLSVVIGRDYDKLSKELGGGDNLMAHELGHALDNHVVIKSTNPFSLGLQSNEDLLFSDLYPVFRNSKSYNRYQDRMPDEEIININKTPNKYMEPSTSDGHTGRPAESYADLLMLRYLLNKAGIFDARTKDIFTKEHLNKFKKNNKNRLFDNFSDEDIIWMMNNVANVNSKKLSPLQRQV